MSDMKDSTPFERRLLAQFQSNPTGLEVMLRDGSEAEVKGYQDRPEGRRLKLRGVRGWVPSSQVYAVRYYVAEALDPATVGAAR